MAQAVTPVDAAATASESRGRFATTIVLGHALKHIYLSAFSTVLIPEIKLGLGLTATQVGSLASVQQFSGWGSTMASGYLGDRFLNKTGLMLAVSLTIMGVAYFFVGLADSYTVLLVAMLFVGIGPSLYHAPALGSLSRRFADRRAFVISMHGAGGSLGEVLGPLIGAGLIAVLVWQDVLRLSIVPALVGAFVMWRLLKNESASHAHQGASSFRAYLGSFYALLGQRALLLICLVSACRSVGQSTTAIFLPIYLREDLGYSAGLVGLYLSMAQLAGVGSQPLMGFLCDRLGHKLVLVPALAAFAFMLLLIPAADGKLQLAIVILVLGVFLFSLHAILISAAAELAGEEVQSTIVSLLYASSFVGSLAPTIAGVLADAHGLKVTFVFASAIVALGVVVLMTTKLPVKTRAV